MWHWTKMGYWIFSWVLTHLMNGFKWVCSCFTLGLKSFIYWCRLVLVTRFEPLVLLLTLVDLLCACWPIWPADILEREKKWYRSNCLFNNDFFLSKLGIKSRVRFLGYGTKLALGLSLTARLTLILITIFL